MAFDQLRIVTPDPYVNEDFQWEVPKHQSGKDNLDWRGNLTSESKVPKEKPIKDFAIEYLERNFSDSTQVISFYPTTKRKAQKEKVDAVFISQLFTQLFEKEFKHGVRAALANYNLSYHADLLKYELKESIKINRAVIFYSELNLIIIVRVASSADKILKESQNCSTDIK